MSVIPNLDLISVVCRGDSEPRLIDNILESISDSVLILGQQCEIMCCNRIAHKMLGYSPAELLEKELSQLMIQHEDNEDFNRISIETISRHSVNNYREVDYHHPDGSTRRLSGTLLEVKDYGTGIGKQDMEYIFNPFFPTLPNATGMGLAVVEKVW